MEEKLPRGLPRDVPDYHERQAARFRALALTTTTARVKMRLLREAEEHEQIARGEPVLAFTDEKGQRGESVAQRSAQSHRLRQFRPPRQYFPGETHVPG